ncbi:MAG: hypothetical protein WC455_18555 [Dehalococcoidia bacterium]
MNCLVCRLALMDALADVIYAMEETAFGLNENEINPQEVVVDGDHFRKVDLAMARLMEFEDYNEA